MGSVHTLVHMHVQIHIHYMYVKCHLSTLVLHHSYIVGNDLYHIRMRTYVHIYLQIYTCDV